MKASHDIQLQGNKFLNNIYLHRSYTKHFDRKEHQQLKTKTKTKRMVIYQKP